MRNTKTIAMFVLMIASIGAGCAGADGQDGADLAGADLAGVNWNWATCPDETAAYNHGQTCVNNI